MGESRQGQRTGDTTPSTHSVPATPLKESRDVTHTSDHMTTRTKPEVKNIQETANNTSPTETFQSRIQHEAPSRERSIGELLSKYRAGKKDTNETERINQRTAQVDHILAKYNSRKKPAQVGDTKSSTVTPTTESSSRQESHGHRQESHRHRQESHRQRQESHRHRQESHRHREDSHRHRQTVQKAASAKPERRELEEQKLAASFKRANTIEYSRVRVPNSAMEYDAPKINSAHDETVTAKPVKQPTTNSHVKGQTSFQATLEAMLDSRQGHHKKRTDAWTTSAAQRETEKQVIFRNCICCKYIQS